MAIQSCTSANILELNCSVQEVIFKHFCTNDFLSLDSHYINSGTAQKRLLHFQKEKEGEEGRGKGMERRGGGGGGESKERSMGEWESHQSIYTATDQATQELQDKSC